MLETLINRVFQSLDYKNSENQNHFEILILRRQLEVTMEFVTSKRIDKWIEKHREQGCVSHATAGEQFVFEFLPSGIVECQTVKCLCCKEEFTDYVD